MIAGVSLGFDIGNNDLGDVLDHCLLRGPMLGGVGHIPITWKLKPRMATWTLALVYQLQWEKITSEASTENCSDLSFVIGPRDFNAFGPFFIHHPH